MFREHESLDTPEDDTILWRYSDLSHFLNLLDRETLYFANRREFEDPWEGAIPATTTEAANRVVRHLSAFYTEVGRDFSQVKGSERVQNIERSIRSRQATYGVNCWHKNKVESLAMWKLYTHGKDGVAIQTTVRRLKECLSGERRPIYIANVLYGDHETLPDLKERPDLEKLISLDVLLTLTTKRLSFAHETEVRLILDRHLDARPAFSQILPAKEENFGPPKGEALKVDLIKVIERIVASPDYPSWAMDSLQHQVTFAKLPVKVEPSDLLRQPKV
jgi:hypothetical protein